VTKILILGANGQLARHTTPIFLKQAGVSLTLYLRRAQRLANTDPSRVRIIEGDVLDAVKLRAAMTGQDVVYANLAGDMAAQARAIVAAMRETGVQRLIFVSSKGIYGEIPGEAFRSILDPYRDSAAIIEASDLNYTVLRPGWFSQDREVNYRITRKGEPFVGHDVSLNSLSDLIVKLSLNPFLHSRESIGVSRG
jgi:uncharacterized protein YbjT (DUF2867 family)